MTALANNAVIGVIGAGTMGAGIAQVAAAAGHQVLLYDVQAGAAEKAIASTTKGLVKLVTRGKYQQAQCDDIVSRLNACTHLADLAPAALIIEVIVENLGIKQQVFNELEGICSPATIFATNTSSISVTSIGATLQKPERLVGMHFFNPAQIMKLVEVISGVATAPEIAQTIYDTALAWGKKPVLAKSTPGFIVNRVARPFYAEGLRVLEEGAADVFTIDTVIRSCAGFRMGPFELMDLIGHDVNYAVTCSVFDSYFKDPRFLPSLTQQELVNAGYLGRKSGRGFYRYDQQAPEQSLVVAEQQIAPKCLVVNGDLGIASPLLAIAEQLGLKVEYRECHSDDILADSLEVDGVVIALTQGTTATQSSFESEHNDLVLFDLSIDYQQSPYLVLTKSDQCSQAALNKAIGFFQALNKAVIIIDDIAGMIAMRTVCMLINEAADTVNQQVCSIEGVDMAMQYGVNYPQGPLVWADQIGMAQVVNVLFALEDHYGQGRYRSSPLLLRKLYSQQNFYGNKNA